MTPFQLTRSALAVVTERSGGVSQPPYDELNLGEHVDDDPRAVAENRRRLAARLTPAPDQMVFLRQVHGSHVVVVDPPGRLVRAVPEADAAVTSHGGIALVVLVADCAPVVLACEDPAVVAVAHAGRRGLTGGVVPATVDAMRALGAHPARTAAFVGPAICGACYEVPVDVQAEVTSRVPAARATTRAGTCAVDVRAGVVAQLHAHGIASVDVDHRCTYESPELFSHRRDGTTGRFAAVAWLGR